MVWWEPLIAAAPGTFHDDLLRSAALGNLVSAGAGRYPRVDPELLLDPRLDLVVAPDEKDLREGFARVARSPAGARLASGAVRVLWLPADAASRPGPRLPDALEALVAAREAEERQGSGVRGQGSGPRPPNDQKPGTLERGNNLARPGDERPGSGVRGSGSGPHPPNDHDATPRNQRSAA
jgi:hypothetical protein